MGTAGGRTTASLEGIHVISYTRDINPRDINARDIKDDLVRSCQSLLILLPQTSDPVIPCDSPTYSPDQYPLWGGGVMLIWHLAVDWAMSFRQSQRTLPRRNLSL